MPPTEEEIDQELGEPLLNKLSLIRVVAAFWLLGLCNNYIYVIMLSAAHDVIHKAETKGADYYYNAADEAFYSGNQTDRNCTTLTTGAILLADIIPTLFVKFLCPFLPFLVHFRILLAVTTGIISLILVANSKTIVLAIIGVCFASFNSGLGEITLLAYATKFVLHAIAGWSSGTGAAGLLGSFAYATMTEGGLTPEISLYISIAIPLLMAVSFWIILKHPKDFRNLCVTRKTPNTLKKLTLETIKKNVISKIKFLPELLPFMIPVGLVYYFEYLINSGLFDKIIFQNTSISKSSQFRWFNAIYQIGVFVSRSSVTWIHFKKIWVMSLLQGINFVIFFFESIYGFIPNVWCMFFLIFWEGLLGGAAYVNTFYNMSYMVKKEQRVFALSIASVADTIGIVLSGITTFPLHKFICGLPFQPSFRWPQQN